MDQIQRLPRTLVVLLLSTVVGAAACGSASSSPVSPSGSSVPGASASTSAAPSVAGPVTSEDDAIARVIAQEPRFTGITEHDPELIGQGSWYEVAPAPGAGGYIVTIRVGWGDCPSGCIDKHTWVYSVAPDGTVTLQSEGGSDVPPDAWPAPGGGTGQQGGTGGTGGTGLHFTALAGPTCPVEQPGDPACAPKPVPNVPLVIMDGAGKVLDKLVLNAAGTGVITLDAGDYVVRAEGVEGYMSGPEAQRVTVVDGRMTEVTLMFDTGMR
jgi:hypothetical protein